MRCTPLTICKYIIYVMEFCLPAFSFIIPSALLKSFCFYKIRDNQSTLTVWSTGRAANTLQGHLRSYLQLSPNLF